MAYLTIAGGMHEIVIVCGVEHMTHVDRHTVTRALATATGVYQMVETYLQFVGLAGANQVRDPRVALVQNIGGTGATVVSHVLQRVD
ncbi:MAG TPA: hypothetical protein VJA26_14990 [Gammaproteobacteria bacterium]|nr:hypothetical protein [Gammaproteobacteria bacterium]